jgi:hypothetical protein
VSIFSKQWRSLRAKFKARRAPAKIRPVPIEALEDRRLLSAWFVSTTGAASNNGSLNAPFATIQEAANVAKPGDTVFIMGGVYHETVTPPTSGTAGAPITFEPYQGQSVTIDGADPISGWTLDAGSIYTTPQPWDLGEGNNQVFVDGTMVNEARWPNTPDDLANSSSNAPANISTPTWATAASVKVTLSTTTALSTVTIYNASLNQPAGTWVGAIAHIEAGQAWVDQVGTITASAPGSITVSYYNETSYQVPQAGNRFYIVGNSVALSSAGEWYRDPVSGNLYLWDPSGDSPAKHTIEAKARDYGFDLSGLSNIDVTNINLFACTINTNAYSSNNVLNGISAQYVSQSIGITPDTLDPWGAQYHPHTTGIILNGTGNVLENSTVAFSSGDGVFLGGSGNTVQNTVIHDADYEAGDEAAITSIGNDETIQYDTIYDTGRSGIDYRYSAGSLITHNVIHTVGLQTTDLGGIYTWGTNGAGTEISYNVIYDIHTGGYGAAGIYLDNTSQNFIIDHNVVFDCDFALKLNPPSWDNLIVNNTFVGTQYALESSGNEDMTGSVLNNNIFVGATMFGPTAIHTNNISSAASADFVNAAQNNYQLAAGSAAINFGTPELPYTANFNGSAPDAGAYEYGSMPFEAGAAAQPFIPPPPTTTVSGAPPAIPTITWPSPAGIGTGTPLGGAQLDATSSIPGTFVYIPAAGTILAQGNAQKLSVTFTPLDMVDYASATASVTINVLPLKVPVITWANPPAIQYGTALTAAQLDATSSVPGAFAYTPLAGTSLGIGNNQTLSVTFTPADTTDYASATASVTINVLPPMTPTISWASPSAIVYGTALSIAQLDATTSIPGTFVYTPALGTILGAGSGQNLSVTFVPTDSVDYTNATSSVAINVVQAAPPTIAWPSPSAIVYGTALSSAQLDAGDSIPGTFAYTPTPGTVLGAGNAQTLSVTFTPTDAIDYTTATSTVPIDVTPATPTIAWPDSPAVLYGTPLGAAQLDATSPIPGTYAYTPAAGTILNAGSGQTLSVTFTPTDAIDYASTTATATININLTPVAPPITWNNPSSIVFGTALGAGQLDATSSIPGAYVYSPAAGAILNAGNGQTLSVTFTPTDTVDYTSGTATATIDVGQATPTITWPNPSSITYGTALGAAQLDATSLVAGTFVYTPVAGTILNAGSGQALSVTFTPTDTADYTSTTASSAIAVNQAVLTVKANNLSRTYGAANPSLTYALGGFVNGDTSSVVSGVPSLSTSAVASSDPGNYPITVAVNTLSAANYTFATANGDLTIGAVSTHISAASSGSSVFGQSVTFTATVTAATGGGVTGTVQFKENGSNLGSPVTLSGGKAVYKTAALAAGTQSITAVYSGNIDYSGSTSNALIQTVAHAATSTALTTSAATATFGQAVTLKAKVAATSPGGGTPVGTVTFKDGSTVLQTVTLVNGAASLSVSAMTAASHTITAVYSGSSNFTASTSKPLAETIKRATTTVILSTSAATIGAGQSLTLTATIKATPSGAGLPPGTVTFKSGTTVLGTMTISSGKAILVTRTLPKGTYKITAAYAGATNFLGDVSPTITQVISA